MLCILYHNLNKNREECIKIIMKEKRSEMCCTFFMMSYFYLNMGGWGTKYVLDFHLGLSKSQFPVAYLRMLAGYAE